MARVAKTGIGAMVLLGVLSGCRCGAPFLGYYTDVRFSPDGQALIVSGNDGLYVARPPTADPERVTAGTCGDSITAGLECVRFSADGSRFAALLAPRSAGTATVHNLVPFALDGAAVGEAEPSPDGVVTTEALDAAFSPDGRVLVWASPGEAEGTVSIHRAGPAGVERLIPSIPVGTVGSGALRAVVVTNHGVAYPRQIHDSVEVWFKPFAEPYLNLGRLPLGCAGRQFSSCVAVSPDGSSFAWQEAASAIVHVFRAQTLVDLPLGQGYGFSFSRTGSYVLRMGLSPDTANVQSVDTARVIRSVPDALSGELSADGETLAWTTLESRALATSRLFVGWSRRDGQDRELGEFEAAEVNPLLGVASGVGKLKHVFTGDGRQVLVSVKGEAGQGRILAVNTSTGEQRELAAPDCAACCTTAPTGALLACLPGTIGGVASVPETVELHDPVTGRRTVVSNKAVDAEFVFDGSGIVVLEYDGSIPEVKVGMKDGRVSSLGSALRFAQSPVEPRVALITSTGTLSVEELP